MIFINVQFYVLLRHMALMVGTRFTWRDPIYVEVPRWFGRLRWPILWGPTSNLPHNQSRLDNLLTIWKWAFTLQHFMRIKSQATVFALNTKNKWICASTGTHFIYGPSFVWAPIYINNDQVSHIQIALLAWKVLIVFTLPPHVHGINNHIVSLMI